ncbi:unnamed protein product [Miscanthus lutarioriparius]|uniref:Uncharacterized protein n=1 Tax=Miscanthus lutarioriparius TaxID=422564 RepID=A0A811Q6J7_9POAL|nr:unnamed protein product [Miscanthus lutarioriparius]
MDRAWETHIGHDEGDSIANGEGFDEVDRMDQMLIDLAGDNPPIVDEQPTPFATTFYRMVDSASLSRKLRRNQRGIRSLSNEYKVAFLYILTNIPEMDDFFILGDNRKTTVEDEEYDEEAIDEEGNTTEEEHEAITDESEEETYDHDDD